MAIGENSYFSGGGDFNAASNSANRRPDYTYYSRLSIIDQNGNKSLKFEFRAGLLIMKIFEKDNTGEHYNQDATEVIYLSTTKAAMLVEQMNKFKEYMNNSKKIDELVAFGVTGGMNEKVSFVAFHTNKEKDVIITIGKFDGAGKITESIDFVMRKNYNFGLDWSKLEENMQADKAFYDYIELDMIHNLVADFSRNMPGGAAYATHDLGRYDLGRILNKMDPIYDKLGIERFVSSNRSRGTNNFLNNMATSGNSFSSNTRSQEVSLDDLTDF